MADGPDRQTELTIDLSEQVNLIRITSSEGLSQHFNTTIDLIAPLGEIDFLKHLGKPAAVKVSEDDEELRYFHGLIADAELLGELDTRGFQYRLTLKPAAYFHSQGRNFRVFQNQKTQEIIDTVLKACNIKADLTKMTDSTPQRAYCVQYGESDFGFVSRLMEEDGLYYFYKHSAAEHVLTVCDAPGSHEEASKASPLTYSETSYLVGNVNSGTRYEGGKKYLHEWRERVSTGAEHKVTLRDFDFMVSGKVEGDSDSQEDYSFEGVEFYNYPARTFENEVSKKRSGVLLESRRANRRVYVGESGNAAIQCGTTFKLEDHSIDRFNGKSYLVAQTHHVISSETYASSMGEDSAHVIQIEAVPADIKWRAPLTSRRPVVLGPETAWVTGPVAEEIFTDEHGRVKIQFHWDREGQRDESSSCWVRVSQTGGLGNLILPRVGHEVLVDFIDGDPDRPIVVGRVFNSTHRPVYALPEHMTRAVWRSRTHKNDKPNTYGQSWVGVPNIGGNEVSMEDTDGKEELLVYGQKDMLTKVQNDVAHHFGNDHDVKIGNNRAMKIGKDDTIEIVGNRDTKIQENEKREITGKRETKITQSELLEVSRDIKITSDTEILLKAEVSITFEVGTTKITMRPNMIEMKTDMLMSDGKLLAEHKGGGNKIQMTPGLMIVNGTLIMIN